MQEYKCLYVHDLDMVSEQDDAARMKARFRGGEQDLALEASRGYIRPPCIWVYMPESMIAAVDARLSLVPPESRSAWIRKAVQDRLDKEAAR
jgi:hypothetical protein